LQFIGNVDGSTFKNIAAELKQIKHKKFDLQINSVGHFDDRILFAAISENESLNSLQKQIVYRLKSLNLEIEVRKFKAHISLAKCKNVNYEEVAKFLLRHSLFKADFSVNEFILFSSELSPKGSTYWHESIYLLK
jgi:2'-5' RNA ligase